MTPSFPQTLTVFIFFFKMILLCALSPPTTLNFTILKDLIGSYPIQKDPISISVCHAIQAIDTSEQVNTLQIQTPKSVGATQHAQGHTAVKEGPHFQVP